MTKQRRRRLNDREKAFVVQQLACYGSPKEVSDALMEEFGVYLAPQNVEAYDPGKRAGQHLGQKWRQLFEHTRHAFLEHVENRVPEAHKAVRIRHLAYAARAYKGQRNYIAMADMLERIAKEVGNVHTNRREFTGNNRGPIKYQDVEIMTDAELSQRLQQLFSESGLALVGLDEVVDIQKQQAS